MISVHGDVGGDDDRFAGWGASTAVCVVYSLFRHPVLLLPLLHW